MPNIMIMYVYLLIYMSLIHLDVVVADCVKKRLGNRRQRLLIRLGNRQDRSVFSLLYVKGKPVLQMRLNIIIQVFCQHCLFAKSTHYVLLGTN